MSSEFFTTKKEKEQNKKICEAVFVPECYVGGTCNLCVHEHENWGDNQHCQNCNNRLRRKGENICCC